jgi:glyoxylase-like metal-dependent hydrolase (beta-lactamase superfamily II)
MLQPISGRANYIPGANNIGVVVTGDGGAIVIDTGIDKDVGRTIRKTLEAARLELRAIINTHHHADHCGGNEFLLRNLPGVQVYAPPLEAALINNPLLEPVYLNQGALPVSALQNKFVMARPSPVHHLIEAASIEVAGVTLEIVPLAGHTLGQIGVAVDDVLFSADGFFGTGVLAKHGIPYAQDIAGQLASLMRLADRRDLFLLPGHGDLCPRDQRIHVLPANVRAVEAASEMVLRALAEPGDLHVVGRRVRAALGLGITSAAPYAVYLSVISAHLTYLAAQGLTALECDERGLVWRAVTV